MFCYQRYVFTRTFSSFEEIQQPGHLVFPSPCDLIMIYSVFPSPPFHHRRSSCVHQALRSGRGISLRPALRLRPPSNLLVQPPPRSAASSARVHAAHGDSYKRLTLVANKILQSRSDAAIGSDGEVLVALAVEISRSIRKNTSGSNKKSRAKPVISHTARDSQDSTHQNDALTLRNLAIAYLERLNKPQRSYGPTDLCRLLQELSHHNFDPPLPHSLLTSVDQILARCIERNALEKPCDASKAIGSVGRLGYVPLLGLLALESRASSTPSLTLGLTPFEVSMLLRSMAVAASLGEEGQMREKNSNTSNNNKYTQNFPNLCAALEHTLCQQLVPLSNSSPATIGQVVSVFSALRHHPSPLLLDKIAETVERRIDDFTTPLLIRTVQLIHSLSIGTRYQSLALAVSEGVYQRAQRQDHHSEQKHPQRRRRGHNLSVSLGDLCALVGMLGRLNMDPGSQAIRAALRRLHTQDKTIKTGLSPTTVSSLRMSDVVELLTGLAVAGKYMPMPTSVCICVHVCACVCMCVHVCRCLCLKSYDYRHHVCRNEPW